MDEEKSTGIELQDQPQEDELEGSAPSEDPDAISAEGEEGNEEPGEEPLDQEGEDQKQEEGKKQQMVPIKRFKEIYKRMGQAERMAAELERKLQETQQQRQQSHDPPRQKPKLEDFDSEEEYFDAVSAYNAERYFQKLQREQQEQVEARKRQEAHEKFLEKVWEDAATIHDFDEVVMKNPAAPLPDELLAVVREGEFDHPARLLHYLAKNEDEGYRVASMAKRNPFAAARMLSDISHKLKAPPRTKTNAPDPVKSAAGNDTMKGFDPETADMESYLAWSEKRERSKRGPL